jgi:hypothetical protein
MRGKSTRIGTYKCYLCRRPFTVKIATIFEDSHIPLHLWLQAIHLLCSSKKGISANQLHRTLGVSLKSAWFLAHRIREAMRSGRLVPLGGEGKTVEADETYFGKQQRPRKSKRRKSPYLKGGGGPYGKRAIMALVERGGDVRTFHVAVANLKTVDRVMRRNIAKESRIHTDESNLYNLARDRFAGHETVKHSALEYVRDDVHTNSAEGYFSIFKRGMRGVYQHCAEKHLHRYLAEFDFRYNNRVGLGINDESRAERALLGVVGKRLTYRDSSWAR